jgi:hypothetical protein
LANPPNPPTNGAPGIRQFVKPMTACSGFAPTFTAMPTTMKAMMVRTLREDNQYSLGTVSPCPDRSKGVPTHLAICSNVHGVYAYEKHPEDSAEDPCVAFCPAPRIEPEADDELCCDKVSCERHGVVEPVVPSERECIRR